MTDDEFLAEQKRKKLLAEKGGGGSLFGISPKMNIAPEDINEMPLTQFSAPGGSGASTDAMAAKAQDMASAGGAGGGGAGKGGGGAAGGMGAAGNVLGTAMKAGMMVWQQKQADKERKKQREHEIAQRTSVDKQRAWGEGAQGEVAWNAGLANLMNRTLL